MYSEAKQNKTFKFEAEKGLLQDQARITGGLCFKNPKLPEVFQQAIFKGKVRERCPRVCDQLVHNSLIGWWWSILKRQKVWRLCSHDHQVVNFFHLVVVLASEKLRKYASDTIT